MRLSHKDINYLTRMAQEQFPRLHELYRLETVTPELLLTGYDIFSADEPELERLEQFQTYLAYRIDKVKEKESPQGFVEWLRNKEKHERIGQAHTEALALGN